MSYVCRLFNASQQLPVSGANKSPDIGIYFLLKVYVQNSLHILYVINLHVGVLGKHFTRSTSMYEMIHPKSPYHRHSFTYILFRLDHVWSWWKRWIFFVAKIFHAFWIFVLILRENHINIRYHRETTRNLKTPDISYILYFWRFMMMLSNGNIFRATGHLGGEFTGPRWIPRTKASDTELWCFLGSASE